MLAFRSDDDYALKIVKGFGVFVNSVSHVLTNYHPLQPLLYQPYHFFNDQVPVEWLIPGLHAISLLNSRLKFSRVTGRLDLT